MSTVEKFASVALSISALAIAGALVVRTFGQSPNRQSTGFDVAAEHLPGWAQVARLGITTSGSEQSPVTLMEFADIECPACREYHETLKAAAARYGDTLRIVYVAYPLRGHRFAVPAARAVECADAHGKAPQMIDALYSGQDSLGLLPWSTFAKRAGVNDSASFDSCSSQSAIPARVDSSLATARRIGLPGTPSVILNGWKLSRPPTMKQIDSTVAAFARK